MSDRLIFVCSHGKEDPERAILGVHGRQCRCDGRPVNGRPLHDRGRLARDEGWDGGRREGRLHAAQPSCTPSTSRTAARSGCAACAPGRDRSPTSTAPRGRRSSARRRSSKRSSRARRRSSTPDSEPPARPWRRASSASSPARSASASTIRSSVASRAADASVARSRPLVAMPSLEPGAPGEERPGCRRSVERLGRCQAGLDLLGELVLHPEMRRERAAGPL